ncbi:outer membrane lipoprotein-sorting protein [Stigmatella aurantiaca]|uniref:Sterol-sensing 5TM box domain protein n=1 Tax=Stigmatella aurantiaca (strain DW4/3-1) TaxID=378806 RepID=Q08Y85_STIAD|nr:outer membrane lipoprotein-sorting protein [Stigmatella aurantiaca]ADO67957.1 Sterol-sensing 5TM box domain protein [Stigmatella aurantiaca DW4/3-1]EAU65426.1 hypothetical protein STIAU_2855 [Stigmatella aurantiaca DW4/3-1]
MLDTVYGAIVRGRWLWIALLVALLGVYGAAASKLKADGSLERIMLKHDPDRLLHEEARATFGSDEVLMVVVTAKEGIFQPAFVERIDRLTRQIEKVDLVDEVYSLSNYEVISGADGELSFPEVIEKVRGGWTAEQLREFALKDAFLYRNIVSEDGQRSAINVRLKKISGDIEVIAKGRVIAEIQKLLEAETGMGPYQLTGWPVIQVEMTRAMEGDLGLLVPLAFGAIALLLVFAFGRPSGVLLPLLGVLLSLLLSMGNLGLAGLSISMITNALPLMIIAVSTTFSIYVMAAIFQALPQEPDRLSAVRSALAHSAPGIFLSGLTTAIGFISLKFNPVEAIDEFGSFAALGVLCATVVSTVFIPALAAVLPLRARPPSRFAVLSHRLQPVRLLPALISPRGRMVATVGTVAMIAGSAYGVARMQIETDPISWFPKDSSTYQTVQSVNKTMVGITPFNIVLETKEQGGLQEPAVLEKIEALQKYLAGHDGVDTTLSYVDLLKMMNRALNDGDPAAYRIPETRPAVAQTMLLYEADGLEWLVTPDYTKANLVLRSHILSSDKNVSFGQEVNAYLASHFAGTGVSARITGTGYLSSKTNLSFTSGMAQSLMLSLALISVVMMIVSRSVRIGLLALIPNTLPIAFNYAILGWTGLTLNAATSITGCIAMGMAVDDTIHFITSFREKLFEIRDVRASLEHALSTVGQPMMFNAFCLSLGFSAFLLSGFEPINTLGLLVAVTMAVAVVCELMLMPNLLLAVGPWLLAGVSKAPPSNTVQGGLDSAAPAAEVKRSVAGSAKVLAVVVGLGSLLAPGPSSAAELTAQEIIDRLTDANTVGFKQGAAEMRLVLQPDGGEKRERRFITRTLDMEGKSRNLIRFLSPAEVQGSAFLMLEHGDGKEDELFVYLPALKRTRRISEAQKSGAFMGSDVSYADLEYQDLKSSSHQKLADVKLDGVDCYQLVSTPKDKERYSKIEVWVRKEGFLAQQLKFYDASGTLQKVFRIHEAKQIDGVWIATKAQAWDKLKKHSSFFFVDSLDTKTPQNAADFTPERMPSN